MVEQVGSAEWFARVSRELMGQTDESPTLAAVVERAVEVVEPCVAASITLRRRRGRTETVATSSELAVHCDELQYRLDQGPCLSAAAANQVLVSQRLADDDRWPQWGLGAVEYGVDAVMSIPLTTVGDETIGALNLYADREDAYPPEEVDLAVVFAVHATNALSAVRTVAGLRAAVDSRHLIGLAQGILMQVYGLDTSASFDLLRRYSGTTNTRVAVVAAHVVEHRTLPDLEEPSAGGMTGD